MGYFDSLAMLDDVLAHCCKRYEAVAGVVWFVQDRKPIVRVASYGWPATGLSESADLRDSHSHLISALFHSPTKTCVVLPPESPFSCPGEPERLNPSPLTIVAAPFSKAGSRTGIVELFFPPFSSCNAALVERLAVRVQTIFDNDLSLDLRNLALAHGRLEVDELRVARALIALHEAADPIAVVFTLANEARRFIGCQRASVLIRRRRRFSLAAISGRERVDRQSHTIAVGQPGAEPILRRISGENRGAYRFVPKEAASLWASGRQALLRPSIRKRCRFVAIRLRFDPLIALLVGTAAGLHACRIAPARPSRIRR